MRADDFLSTIRDHRSVALQSSLIEEAQQVRMLETFLRDLNPQNPAVAAEFVCSACGIKMSGTSRAQLD